MNLSPELIEELELALQRLERLDPTELPEPAADLVDLLSRILDESEDRPG